MKIKENMTVYLCDFCKKKLFVKSAMERHEHWCTNNPKNMKACVSCKYLEETTIDYIQSYSTPYGESEHEKKAVAFRCTKLEKMLYPMICEKRDLINKYPETFDGQEPMPNECEHRKDFF